MLTDILNKETITAWELNARKCLLSAKLAVMEKVRRVEKTRRMASGNGGYQYAGAEEVIAEIRPAMVMNGLSIAPVKSEMVLQDKLQLASSKSMTHMVLKVTFRLSHMDGGAEDIETFGEAADSMDKSCNKCMTAALKYALLQTFLLQGAHDDPDDYASQEQRHEPEPKPAQNTSRLAELKHTAHDRIKSMKFHEFGDSCQPFVVEAKIDAEGLPPHEQNEYMEAVCGYWFWYRINFVQTPEDGAKVERMIGQARLGETNTRKLKDALAKQLAKKVAHA